MQADSRNRGVPRQPTGAQAARARLTPAVRRREDEQDLLQSMYASFCARQQRGDFELSDRHDLWRLLVEVTLNKARKAAVRHSRRKRDYRRETDNGDGEGEGAI